MKKITSILINQMLIYEIIPEKMKDVYQYGIELIFSSLVTILSIIILASFFDTISIGIWSLVISIPLKVTVGGYHAPTYKKCYIISNLEYIFQSLVIDILSRFSLSVYFWATLLSCSIFFILINTPVKNIHHPISDKVLKKNQIFSIFFLSADCLVLITLYFLKKYLFVYWGILCILTIAIAILPTKKERGRKYASL